MNQQNFSQNVSPVLSFLKPFSTFVDGQPQDVPFVVDGLFTQGGFSIIGAKPKQGKTSMSRLVSVAVAKGLPFLDRETTRGEVILVSLEDPLFNVDNHLNVLGYNPEIDAEIRILGELPQTMDESLLSLRHALAQMPDVRLVVIDHLALWLRLKDITDYMAVLRGCSALRAIAKDYPNVHILAVAHSKKTATSDPFDGFLGSTALRGVADTNLALFEEMGQHIIAVETRMGVPFPPSILKSDIVVQQRTTHVRDMHLGESFEAWKSGQSDSKKQRDATNYVDRVLTYLEGCEGQTSPQKDLLANVQGKQERLLAAIKQLESECLVMAEGSPKVLTVNVDAETLRLYRMGMAGNK